MRTVLAASVVALTLASNPAAALDRGTDGWFRTGEGVRVKKVAFIKVKIYQIEHAMKELPAERSKEAVVDSPADKKLAFRLLRSVPAEKVKAGLREAYQLNGFTDQARIDRLLAPLEGELAEGSWVTVRWDAAAQRTTLASGGKTASVDGAEFMRATWRIWFGKIDQPSLTDSLMSKID